MDFEYRASLPVAVNTLWTLLVDIPAVALCIPGVVSVEPLGEDRYRGVLKLRIGPVGLELGGQITVEELLAAERQLVFSGEAKDKRIPGGLRTRTQLVLTTLEPELTELLVVTEAHILGKLGEFGQSIIKRKTDQVMQQFTDNLARKAGEPTTT